MKTNGAEADAGDAFFEKAYRRISRFMIGSAVLGAVAAFWYEGLRGSAGFLIGAAFSIVNFRWMKQLAAAIGSKGPPKTMGRAIVFGMRYFLFGLAGYVIVKVFGISLLAVLAGLFVAAAAVVLEIIYELIYARA
jgi:hypothetical protein